MKKLLFGLLLFAGLGASPALAGSGTFPLTPCTSGCTNQGITTDGSSNIYPNAAIVDGTAAANKAGVDSSGGLTIKGEGTAGTPAGGVLTIQGGSGGTAVPAALNTTPSLANGNGVVITQSGNAVAAGNPTFAALSIGGAVNAVGNPIFVGLSIGGSSVGSANGIYSNLLQGNSVLGVTNGIYANILQGNAALSSGNPIFAQVTAGSAIIGKVDIDQTTPGTTNGVQINNSTILTPTIASAALVKGTTAAMTGTTSTSVITAVTSQHIYVTAVHCNNTGAAATLVSIQDGSGGTTLDTLICPAGGGDERNGGGAPLFWTTAGNALFAANVTTGQSVIVQASGYSSAN